MINGRETWCHLMITNPSGEIEQSIDTGIYVKACL